MAEGSIPVDLLNPGQVFACLGFLEAADVLCGDAEGGFDWRDESDIRFKLSARGEKNPVGVVLGFLADARILRYAPPGYRDPQPKKKSGGGDKDRVRAGDEPVASQTFPGPDVDTMTLPIGLVRRGNGHGPVIRVGHWADGSSRNQFKLYSGNRSAASIAGSMLFGTRGRPKKGRNDVDVETRGLRALWEKHPVHLEMDPFGLITPVGGSFNFDPRGAWTGIDAGYSPNDQQHDLAASPVVEILAAIGLEHARPDEYATRRVRYAAWGCHLPPRLARPALAGATLAFPMRLFSFELALAGKNKIVTFAEEEKR